MTLSRSKRASPYRLKCLCGSKQCRGCVTDEDWKIPALQRKYKGYFQYYIQKKIDSRGSKWRVSNFRSQLRNNTGT